MNKSSFYIFIAIIILVFLYLVRGILTPFILAAIFAYVFNPVVNLIARKARVSKTLAIILVYVVIFAIIGYVTAWLGGQLFQEAKDLARTGDISKLAEGTIQK